MAEGSIDVLVIGAGPAGCAAAITAARGGARVLVLDRARTAVVLEEARPYHPMTFLRAIVDVARRPLWWLSGALIDTAKNAVGIAALLFIVSHDLGAAGIWIARLAGLLALMLGMWRVSLARL